MSAPDPSKLDLQQILQRVYDEAAGKLRTSATASIGDITVAVDLVPTDDGVYIADKDTGNKLKVSSEGAIHIDKGLLAGISFDDIQATYPSSTTENYYYYLSTVLQATVQVTYSDSTKEVLTRARRI